jgi:hypothetical protein
VKVLNPFQVGSLNPNLQYDKRERFKKIFWVVLAAHIVLFLSLLIQGCRSGQHTTASELPDTTIADVR